MLDKGFVMEFDTPQALLAQQGILYQMARDAGLAREARHVMTASQNESASEGNREEWLRRH